MGGILINAGVINYGGLPSGGSGLLAARPAAGVVGRIYIASDSALLYRDTGSAWVTIGAGGPSGSGAAGQVTFWTGASAISGDNKLFWDNTNKRLGVNTNAFVDSNVRMQINNNGIFNQVLALCGNGGGSLNITSYYTRNTTYGSFTATADGDQLFGLNWSGSSATGYTGGGYYNMQQVGAAGVNTPSQFAMFLNSASVGSAYSVGFSCLGFGYFTGRWNVNNATDNALFELNVNGNTYTGGLSPTILTVGTNTTMARTATGYYCTASLTLTLPSAASINNVYWIIAASGVTVTVNRAGSDDILNLAGASVTTISVTSNQRAMFYVGGGTRTFLISQA